LRFFLAEKFADLGPEARAIALVVIICFGKDKGYETYVSTLESSAQAPHWFSRPDGDTQRPSSAETAACQGP